MPSLFSEDLWQNEAIRPKTAQLSLKIGDWHLKKAKDGYGYQTKDDSLCCHFEHTIAVTENDCQVLTSLI